ncbi:MAG TPA: DUF1446 domain-containing protein [Chitinophagales bacterium]|nr:DUF1446 domain-containing protein [Chitinophagales bacterium]HNL84739.1 DUF1446 domain-containing protein [Chitinophagales bacterium]
MKQTKIAGAQGFYGDSPLGAIQIAMQGEADYLMHDALAELTLSILQKDKLKDPSMGYARDIEVHARTLYPIAFSKGIKIVTNSGGLNPESAAEKVKAILEKQGIKGIKIATISGDDVLSRLPEFKEQQVELNNLDDNTSYYDSKYMPTHANVYIGAQKVKEALDNGANLILAGRVADPCLALGILAHEFNWKIDDASTQEDLDRMAFAITIGHILECGGQASGGNAYSEWPMHYSVSDLGYPIAQVNEDCTAILTKAKNTGGKVSRNTIREQLVYEIHDPTTYITPDVVVDLSNIKLEDVGENEVSISGIKGKPRPEKLKLCIGQMEGYVTEQFFFFSYPFAYDKLQMFIKAVKETWAKLPVQILESRFNIIGVNGLHEDAVEIPDADELNQRSELGLRIAIKHKDDRTGKTAIAGITCLGLNGPPGVISVPGWGNMNRAMLSLFPCLIPRELIEPKVDYVIL